MTPRTAAMFRRVAPAIGFLIGATIPAYIKLQDVRAVRVAVPDLGYWESITWPLDEVREPLRFGWMTHGEARAWVAARRAR